jgi:hypothetical protein
MYKVRERMDVPLQREMEGELLLDVVIRWGLLLDLHLNIVNGVG